MIKLRRLILIPILAIVIVVMFIFGIKVIKNEIDKYKEKKIKKALHDIYYRDTIDIFNSEIINGELINMLIQPNNDWSKLPLSKHFKRKFNSKYGVLGNIKADKIELDPYTDGRFTFDEYSYILVTQGLKQTAYIYHIEVKNRVFDDFWLTQTYEITDEYGNQLDMVSKIEKKTFEVSFRKLAAGYKDEKSVGVSQNYKNKYSCFLDLFIHYSPLECNQIQFVREKSSWRRKEAYFEVDSTLECKKREYVVKFTLDKKGYLDVINVELKKESEYEAPLEQNMYGRYAGAALFYKNSKLDNLPISRELKEKYYTQNAYFPKIDLIDLTVSFDDENTIIDDSTNLHRLKFIDGHYYFYLIESKYNKDYEVSDVQYTELEYVDISLYEAHSLYTNEKQYH